MAIPAKLSAATCRKLILRALCSPKDLAALRAAEWEPLLQLARGTGVLARLAMRADEAGVTEKLPPRIRSHLEAAKMITESQTRALKWEINRIERALMEIDVPVITLKGAAYVLAGLEAARGRTFRDVDILVPREQLDVVEAALLQHGWTFDEGSPYDAQYYRKWLHELPPMQHAGRKTAIDVHHTILPPTDRLRVRPGLLFEDAQPAQGCRFLVPAAEDMVLHAAAHMFRNGEFTHALRDLCDIDLLLREFSTREGFWDRLVTRANKLDLTAPCSHALRNVERFLGTPIPAAIMEQARRWRPTWPVGDVFDALVGRAVFPQALEGTDAMRACAAGALSYWPLPRLRAVVSVLFWAKRLIKHPPKSA